MTTQNLLIQPSKKTLYFYYKTFDFSDLWYAQSNGRFIGSHFLRLIDHAGTYYTAQELIFYPELTKQLRQLKHYPLLEHTFKMNRSIKGEAFIDYFYFRVKAKLKHFKKWMAYSARKVDQLTAEYGSLRQQAIIDEYIHDGAGKHYFMINGVQWQLRGVCYCDNDKGVHYTLDLRGWLGELSKGYHEITLEKIISKTPYIALRFKKTYKHTGHIRWFNINTSEEVPNKTINKLTVGSSQLHSASPLS